MSEQKNITSNVTAKGKGFFQKLSNGDFGLAKTYWLYGVLVGSVLNLALNFVTSSKLWGFLLLVLVYTAYEIPRLMGTWRAANRYEGRKLWAILAKISTILSAISVIFGLIAIIGLLARA